MSSGFVCGDFLKLKPKFFKIRESDMKNKKNLNLLYHRHSWLSKIFYRIQRPLISRDLRSRETLLFVSSGDQI